MGYRFISTRRTWLKPVGVVLFTFEEERLEWTNWFLNAVSGKTHGRWQVEEYDEIAREDPLTWIKTNEAWTNTSAGSGGRRLSQFQLSIDPEHLFDSLDFKEQDRE